MRVLSLLCVSAFLMFKNSHYVNTGFPGGTGVKKMPASTGDAIVGKSLWRRKSQLTPVFLLGKSHGQRRLAGYSP